jgi:F0F1-type ATP synthase assembly protein I
MIISNKNSKKITESYRSIGPYIGLGTQLAATVVLMFFIGKWLDAEFGTFPWFIVIFTMLGSFAGLYNFIKTVLNLNKKKKIDKPN